MKKSITLLAAAVLVVASTSQAELVINFGTDAGEIPGTTGTKTDATVSALLTNTAEASTYTVGTFSALPSGNPGSGVTFDLVLKSSAGRVRAQGNGLGVNGGTANNIIDNSGNGSQLEWMSFSLANVTGLGAGDELVITSLGVLYGGTNETYRLAIGSADSAPLGSDINFSGANSEILAVNSGSVTLGAGSAGDNRFALGAVTIDVIPEPATLGLISSFSGAVLFIRRRFMM